MLTADVVDWGVIYHALIHAIQTNAGIGFINGDQGHPAYKMGAIDGRRDETAWGDSPEQNHMYKMLVALSETYGRSGGVQIMNWKAFCQLAYESYQKAKQDQA